MPMISLADLQRRIDAGDLSRRRRDRAVARSDRRAGQDHRRLRLPCRKSSRGKAPGRCAASRSASRTSSIPRIFRPRWARRSTGDIGRARDAPVVMMLKQAGATIVGKTTTTAFASVDPTRDAQSAQPRPYAGRIVVGLGGGGRGRHDSAGAGNADRRLGDPAGLVLRRRRDQAVFRLLPTVGVKCYSWTLDTVGLFAAGVDDLAHGLSAMTGRPELLPCASIADAAHRRRDAGFCRRAGSQRARRRCGSQRRAAERAGATVRDAGFARDRRGGVANPSDRAGIRGASGAGLGIPRELRRDAAAAARTARRKQGPDARRLRRGARRREPRAARRWRKCSTMSTCC